MGIFELNGRKSSVFLIKMVLHIEMPVKLIDLCFLRGEKIMRDSEEDFKEFKDKFLSSGQIAAKKQAGEEESLLESKIEAFYLTSNQFLYVSGLSEFSMLSLTRNVKKLLGYNQDELTTELLYEYTHPEDKEILYKSILWCLDIFKNQSQKFSKLDAVFSIDYRLKHKQGNYIRFLRSTSVLESTSDNKMSYLLNVFTDINDQKKTGIPEVSLKFGSGEILKFSLGKSLFTSREMDVLKEMVNGFSGKEIADKLCISESTVVTHRKNMLKKTSLKKSVELVKYALDNNIF